MSTEALRAALATLESAEANYRFQFQTAPTADHLDVGRAWDRMKKAGDAARAALAQRADEPVAWMNVKYGTFFGAGVIAATDRKDDLIASGELIPLYAAPAAPAYVPLSNDDLAEVVVQEQFLLVCDGMDEFKEIARAIESLVVARMRGEGK